VLGLSGRKPRAEGNDSSLTHLAHVAVTVIRMDA
jgi:hypothetical protein